MSLNDIFSRSNSHYFSRPDIGVNNFNLDFTYNPGGDNNKIQYVMNSAMPSGATDIYDPSKQALPAAGGYPLFDEYNAALSDTTYYILREDLICNNLIIPEGKTLFTNGYKIYCQKLVVSGTISANGKDGRPGVIRPTYTKIIRRDSYGDIIYESPDFRSYTTDGYVVSLGLFDNNSKRPPFDINSRSDSAYEQNKPNYSTSIGNVKADGGLGVIGGDGTNKPYIELSSETQSVGSSVANSLAAPVAGTANGGGGGGSAYGKINTEEFSQQDGSPGGGAIPPPLSTINIESLLMGYNESLSETRYFGAGAGGGGGGSTQSSINSWGAGDGENYRGLATGGCGGDGGGGIWISARNIIITTTGIISANGGNGGNGAAYTDVRRSGSTIYSDDKAYSYSGGGGGGGGGWIILFTERLINNGTVSVRGGSGGSSFTSYISSLHSSRLVGGSGDKGEIYIIKPSSPHFNGGFTVTTAGELSKSGIISNTSI